MMLIRWRIVSVVGEGEEGEMEDRRRDASHAI